MAEKLVGHDHKVCHLEGQCWADEGPDFPHAPAETVIVAVTPGDSPAAEFIPQREVDAAIRTMMEKENRRWPSKSNWRN
jgi:hypothetical protein